MSNEWKKRNLVPIYKNKWDIQNCVNYKRRLSIDKRKDRQDSRESIWLFAKNVYNRSYLSSLRVDEKVLKEAIYLIELKNTWPSANRSVIKSFEKEMCSHDLYMFKEGHWRHLWGV